MARLSPWIFAGIGCLSVAALGVVAVGGVGFMVSKTVREELSKPVDKAKILATLDVPLHPKAQFDEELTRAMRTGSVMASKLSNLELTMAAFRLSAPEAQVQDWYKEKMRTAGFQLTESSNQKGLAFVKKSEQVFVSCEKAQLTIIRTNVPGTK
jgi:hypothetical protein